VDVLVGKYAPVPAPSLSALVGRLRYAVPQWVRELPAALQRARQRLAHEAVEGVTWYWPEGEAPRPAQADGSVRLLAPFDPLVWDRRRFQLLWGWAYRFEAYTPPAKRKLGYYALPLLWRDRVVGWGSVAVKDDTLEASLGYVEDRPPREAAFRRELEAELERMRSFLGLASSGLGP
jgi:uncharacterized protein YcaQ